MSPLSFGCKINSFKIKVSDFRTSDLTLCLLLTLFDRVGANCEYFYFIIMKGET